MTRIRFEDLPSTNTPRNAENLNKLNNVVISSTEPTTGEEVWIQKSKNYFNYEDNQPDTTFTEKVTINNEKAFKKFVGPTQNLWAIFHLDECGKKLKENEKYTISFDIWADKNTAFGTKTLYVNPLTTTTHNLDNITTQKQRLIATFTYKSSTGSLLHIYPMHIDGNILYISNVQIEQGSTATSYEPYVDKKIYTKNDNGVYEEFDNSIVESGSNSNGNWVKFKDGRMECNIEKTVTFNFSLNQKWGIVWESDGTDLGNFPSNFIEKPQISVDNMSGSGGFIECLQETTYSHIGKLWMCRPVETEGSVAYTLSIIAKGRWK